MRGTGLFLLLFGLLCLLAGCTSNPNSQPLASEPGEPFQLSPGQSARLDEPAGELVIQFTGVSSDSRCPSDVVCVQAGEALVNLSLVLDGQAQAASLSTSGNGPGSTQVGGYTIQLVSLEPYPVSTTSIDPLDYLATLLVEIN